VSDLIAIAYPDHETAQAVRRTLGDLADQHTLELEDAVVVTRDEEGNVKLYETLRPVAAGATGGALCGGMLGLLLLVPLAGLAIGLLLLVPLIGAAVGAAAGTAAGVLADVGIDDDFVMRVGAKLAPGGSALIVLIRKVTPEKALPDLQRYGGGEVIQTSLND
jgi:uncharacterized membrane protein